MNGMDFLGAVGKLPCEPETGDFVRDGLLHCGRCGTPRQTVVELPGGTRTVNCLCKCRKEAYDREAAEFARMQEEHRLHRLKTTALNDRAYRSWTFAGDDGKDPKMVILRRYAAQWDSLRQRNIGLLLWGDVSTGKSYGAACIVNELTGRGVRCLMTTFAKIERELFKTSDKNALLRDITGYPLLVLDDLGAERQSEYMQQIVFDIIDDRYRAKLPLIVTTNLPLSEIREPQDGEIMRRRIYERVLEMTTPVKFTVPRRRETHDRKFREFQEICGEAEK